MRLNPLIHMPFANVGSRVDDVSAAVIIIGAYALFLAVLLVAEVFLCILRWSWQANTYP
jgi:hypothetical protein